LLFIARAFSLMAFTVSYLFTPEVYSQPLRATGLGVANMWARVGGGIAPFIAQGLSKSGNIHAIELIFACVAWVGTVSALSVPVETAGMSLGAGLESSEPKGESEMDDDDAAADHDGTTGTSDTRPLTGHAV
jgi:hypothetical protein